MRNFKDTFETRNRPFISTFSVCMIVPLSTYIYIGKGRLRFFKRGWNQRRSDYLKRGDKYPLRTMRTHPCIKDWDEISSRSENKEKRRVSTSSGMKFQSEHVFFFFNFWRMFSNMLYNVNMFEHNECMNKWT